MAGFEMNLSGSFEGFAQASDEIHRTVLPVAEARSLNKVGRSAESAVVRHLAKDIGVPQKVARRSITVWRATRTNRVVAISANGRRIPLAELAAREVRSGVSYRGMDGRRRKIKGAFIAEMSNGHVGVFKRRGRARLPIDEKFGPSIPHVFVKDASIKVMRETAGARWPIVFSHEVDYELIRRGLVVRR